MISGSCSDVPLLLLDIDETLVHVTTEWLARAPDWTFRLQGTCFHVYIRPGVYTFLRLCFESGCCVGVWTAAEREYAVCVLKRLLGRGWRARLACFLHRGHCTVAADGTYYKTLSRLRNGFPHRRVLLVDDNLDHYFHNAHFAECRVLPCRPYLGSVWDGELRSVWRSLRILLALELPRTFKQWV